MFGLGVQELLVILLLVLIFFGAEKIPQLAKSLGKGMAEFKKAQQDIKEELDHEPEPTVAATSDKQTVAGPVTCHHCGGQTAAGSLFCSQCGSRMNGELRCSLCQRQLQPEEKFCPNCGTPSENSPAQSPGA